MEKVVTLKQINSFAINFHPAVYAAADRLEKGEISEAEYYAIFDAHIDDVSFVQLSNDEEMNKEVDFFIDLIDSVPSN